MRRALFLTLAALALAPAAAQAQQRPRWDTRVLTLIQRPGFPAHAYVHPNGRIYEGTYLNPNGSDEPSRVFEYTDTGDLQRTWTVQGQDVAGENGVQVATSDAAGRLVLLDRRPARVLILDRTTGEQTVYATFPDLPLCPGDATGPNCSPATRDQPATPNYAAWGPDGSLYVTDYLQAVVWRVPPRGGTPEVWLADRRLDGDMFGTTGLELVPGGRALLVGQGSSAGLADGNPATGKIYTVPIGGDGRPGAPQKLWESQPTDVPDGFGIAKSGRLYVALVGTAAQIAVVNPDGSEAERFPPSSGGGENGSTVPFDSPSNASFIGTRIMVANQSYTGGEAAHQAILDVEVGEEGAPELIPENAGPPDTTPPGFTVALDSRRLRLTLDERARVTFVIERRAGVRWRRVRRTSRELDENRHVLTLRSLVRAKRRLKRGAWRVTVSAVDASGNASAAVRRSARVR